jgi:hypothetical protein
VTLRTLLPLLAVATVVSAVACSAGSTRTPFGDESPTDPAATSTSDQTAAKPPATPPSGPVTSTGDASVPDAPDTCVRTAPSNACGLAPQCGCAGGGTETCDVQDATGNVACVAAGKAAMGHPCTTTAGCAAGLTCVGGTCHAYCDTAGAACGQPGTGSCLQIQSNGVDVPNLKVCLVSCDLRDANACGGTTAAGTAGCVVDDTGNTDCQKAGAVALNAACSATSVCAPSLVCVNVSQGSTTSSVCKKWCRVGTSDCGGTTACTGFQTKVLVSGTEYGVCP